ncbi:MAG: hypothetical protein HQM15_02670 [Deltaproteobacteria bacterium]|nr:hypothetical protein [Deltaproteobacteria bacterium]
MIYFQKIILFLILFFPSPLFAKDWNPNLLEASRLAYAAETAQALPLINAYIAQNPEDPNGLFVKAVVLDWKATLDWEGRNSQKEILEIYKQANDLAFHLWDSDPENVDKLINLGNSYLFLGRKYSDLGKNLDAVLTGKKCQKYLEKAIKLDPSRKDALLALGGFHYLADQIPPWLKSFRGLLGIKGDKDLGLTELKYSLDPQLPFYYDSLYALVNVYSDFEKQYETALQYLTQMEKIFPNNPELKFYRANISEKKDKTEGLSGFLKLGTWCEKNPNHCHPEYSFLGYYHAGRISQDLSLNDQAQKYFAKSLEFNPLFHNLQKAEASYWSANIDFYSQKYTEALQKIRQALQVQGLPKKNKQEMEDRLTSICQKISCY